MEEKKMLHIHSVRIFEECEESLRKNLQTDKAFVFNQMAYRDFFAKNISVYAIVGKNGSGKSTLLEIMFRMVNNLSYVLLHHDARGQVSDICLNGMYKRTCIINMPRPAR